MNTVDKKRKKQILKYINTIFKNDHEFEIKEININTEFYNNIDSQFVEYPAPTGYKTISIKFFDRGKDESSNI